MVKSWRTVEHIARLEQRQAIKDGRFISWIHTPSIKKMNNKEKEGFFNYLKKKSRYKRLFFIIPIILLAIFFISNFELTGRVIENNSKIDSGISIVSILIFFAVVVFGLYVYIRERKIARAFRPSLSLFEERFL